MKEIMDKLSLARLHSLIKGLLDVSQIQWTGVMTLTHRCSQSGETTGPQPNEALEGVLANSKVQQSQRLKFGSKKGCTKCSPHLRTSDRSVI